jgi:hypothetical protein
MPIEPLSVMRPMVTKSAMKQECNSRMRLMSSLFVASRAYAQRKADPKLTHIFGELGEPLIQ